MCATDATRKVISLKIAKTQTSVAADLGKAASTVDKTVTSLVSAKNLKRNAEIVQAPANMSRIVAASRDNASMAVH